MPLKCSAGINATTVHSRANCINNESITWYLGHSFIWRVVSIHQQGAEGPYHVMDTGYTNTWRQAAVHWGESTGGNYIVWGYHYLYNWGNGRYFASTEAEDCAIYDGWWDYN